MLNGVANFDVAIDNFPVGDLLDLLQSDVDLQGLVSLHGSMQGTLAAPTMRGALGLVNGVYKGDTVPDLHGTFGYANRALGAHLDLLHRGRAPMATVTANLPVNLALSGVNGPRLLRQQPVSVDVAADKLNGTVRTTAPFTIGQRHAGERLALQWPTAPGHGAGGWWNERLPQRPVGHGRAADNFLLPRR